MGSSLRTRKHNNHETILYTGCSKGAANKLTMDPPKNWITTDLTKLTFFGADRVEIAGREASSERPMEPLVSALLILHRLLVERDGLLQRLVCNKHTKPMLRTQISVCLMIRGILNAFLLWKSPSLCFYYTAENISAAKHTVCS